VSTHPEYWTPLMYDRLTSYLDAGGSLAYLGGNGVFETGEYDDDRTLATIDTIPERLTDDRGLVPRHRTEEGVDGLAAEEGTFLLCTSGPAPALALAGQVDGAREAFERAAAVVDDLGLLATEVDPVRRRAARNVPQASNHIGLVNAAGAIDQAERAR
jgi:GH15 family glucan-1,4-alpha-glucosidase